MNKPIRTTVVFALALGVLCWVRSGICYSGTPLRALTAELVTVITASPWWEH